MSKPVKKARILIKAQGEATGSEIEFKVGKENFREPTVETDPDDSILAGIKIICDLHRILPPGVDETARIVQKVKDEKLNNHQLGDVLMVSFHDRVKEVRKEYVQKNQVMSVARTDKLEDSNGRS